MLRNVGRMIAFGLAVTATQAAAEWIKVSRDVAGSDYYMDPARMTKTSNRVQAWVKVDHSKNRSISYRSEMQLHSFICAAQKSRLLSFTEYDSYGKVVRSKSVIDTSYSDIGYDPITPETVGETLMRIACGDSEGS